MTATSRCFAAILALASGCAAPYQPATTTARMPVPQEKLEEIFLRHFPRLEHRERDPLVLRSAWTDGGPGEVVIELRGHLAVTPDPAAQSARIDVVVQRRVLRSAPFSLPEWKDAGSDQALEDLIVRQIEELLGG